MSYSHNAAEIAAKLREIADKFDSLGDMPIPETWVSVDVQVCNHDNCKRCGDQDERKAAVDVLLTAIGAEGRHGGSNDSPLWRGDRGDVCVYTPLQPLADVESAETATEE